MKINKRREELKESIREAKRVCRKAYRLHKYGTKGTKNENDRKSYRKKGQLVACAKTD